MCESNEKLKQVKNQEITADISSENDSIIETSLNDVGVISKSNREQIQINEESSQKSNEEPKDCSLLNNYDMNGIFLPSSTAFDD